MEYSKQLRVLQIKFSASKFATEPHVTIFFKWNPGTDCRIKVSNVISVAWTLFNPALSIIRLHPQLLTISSLIPPIVIGLFQIQWTTVIIPVLLHQLVVAVGNKMQRQCFVGGHLSGMPVCGKSFVRYAANPVCGKSFVRYAAIRSCPVCGNSQLSGKRQFGQSTSQTEQQ